MAVFSKLIDKFETFSAEIKNMLYEVTYLPYGFCVPVFGTVLICVVSYYIFKWLSSDVDVPVRDSSKTHNWKAIKLAAKVVRYFSQNSKSLIFKYDSPGTVPFVRHYF